jgi:cell division transport system permease protein
VISLAVLLLGVYLTISLNSVKVLKLIRDKVEIDAYLNDGLSQAEVSKLISEIKSIGGVKTVTYISKEEAAKIFKQDFGEDILEVFDHNPLPASLKINLYDEYKTIDRIEKIKAELLAFRQINDIVYAQKNLEIIERNASSLIFLNLSLLVIIAVSSVFLVGNTIRLMIESKKDTIIIMKLIGAAKETIRIPFIMEGLFQGFTGSLLAVVILQLFLNYFYSAYSDSDFSFSVIDFRFIVLLILFGTALGTSGSAFSVRKYLKFS